MGRPRLNRTVVKAFQQYQAEHLLEWAAKGTPGPSALTAQGTILQQSRRLRLVDEIGVDGVEDGTLDESVDNNPTAVYGQTSIPRVFVARCQRQARNENLSRRADKPALETLNVENWIEGSLPEPQ